MFVGQAAEQYRLFTGRPAPLERMRAVLEQALEPDPPSTSKGR